MRGFGASRLRCGVRRSVVKQRRLTSMRAFAVRRDRRRRAAGEAARRVERVDAEQLVDQAPVMPSIAARRCCACPPAASAATRRARSSTPPPPSRASRRSRRRAARRVCVTKRLCTRRQSALRPCRAHGAPSWRTLRRREGQRASSSAAANSSPPRPPPWRAGCSSAGWRPTRPKCATRRRARPVDKSRCATPRKRVSHFLRG